MKLYYPNYLLLSSITLSLGLGALHAQTEEAAEAGGIQEAEALFVLPSEDAEADPESQPVDQAKEDEIFTVLPEFVVSSEKDDGYYSAHTLGGTRTSALIKDTPMTIGVVNAEMMSDLGLSDINDLAQVLAGVEVDLDSGFNDRVVKFRGLNTRSQLFEFLPRGIDQDSYNIERSEIIRGANSLIYGQADPGGKINFLGKRAHFNKNETTIGAKVGSYDLYRGEFDTNYIVNDKLAVRTMATYQEAGAHLDNKEKTFQGVTLEATYRLSNKTEFRLHLEQVYGERRGGSYNILEDNTFANRGTTGIPQGLPLSADLVDFLPNDLIREIINFNDGAGIPSSAYADSDNVPDFFTSKADVENYFERLSLDRDELGEFRGNDVFREINGYYFIGEMTHSFTDDLHLKLVLGHEQSDTEGQNVSGNNVFLTSNNDVQGLNGNNPRYRNTLNYYNPGDPLAGGTVTGDWDFRPAEDTFDNSYSLRSTLSWHKELWGTKQQFIFSYDFDLKDIGSFREDFLVNGATVNPVTGGFLNNQLVGLSYTINSEDPDFDFDDTLGDYYSAFNQESTITTHAFWFANQGSYFNGRLNTLVGARFDFINAKSLTDDIKGNNGDTNAEIPVSITNRPPNEAEADFSQVSPTIGFLVALTDHVGFFANYSKSIQSPNGFDTNPLGDILTPEIGTGYEGGFKFEALDGKLHGQLVAYHITKENDITRFSSAEAQEVFPQAEFPNLYTGDRWDPLGQNRTDGTVVETQGIELSFNYNPIREVSLAFQYAYIEAEVIENDLSRLEGTQQNGYSPHSATFSARYTFKDGEMKGLYLGTNMKYKTGARFSTIRYLGEDYEIDLDDSFTTAVFVGWKGPMPFSENKRKAPRLSVQLNVNNVFNEQALVARGSGNAAYERPRSFFLETKITF